MRNKGKISASIMCGDLLNMQAHISELEQNNIEFIHIDIADMSFVPNLIFGIDTVNQIKKYTTIPLDIHIMADYPMEIIKSLNISNRDIVSVHMECKDDINKLSMLIKSKGGLAGLAIKPSTELDEIRQFLPMIDNVIMLSVEPGFFGQPFVESAYDRIKHIKSLISEIKSDITICVDGGINPNRAIKMKELGAEIFVCGTSSIYKNDNNLSFHIDEFRRAIND